jgi:hypothetical protein
LFCAVSWTCLPKFWRPGEWQGFLLKNDGIRVPVGRLWVVSALSGIRSWLCVVYRLLHLRLSLLLDPQEKEGRLYFLLDFRKFGRGNLTVVRMIGWCCLLRLFNALVQTHLVIFPLQDELLLGNGILQGGDLFYRLQWIIFQPKVNEVFKPFWLFSIRVVKRT